MIQITEAQARKIHEATDLSIYSLAELRAADLWLQDYAITKLRLRIRRYNKPIREFIFLMATVHKGSTEVNRFFQDMGCYPPWA